MTTATLTPAAAAKIESATTNATAMLHDVLENVYGQFSRERCQRILKTDPDALAESVARAFNGDSEIAIDAKTQIALWALEARAGGHTAKTCSIAFMPYNEHGRLCLYGDVLPLTQEELQERRERQD